MAQPWAWKRSEALFKCVIFNLKIPSSLGSLMLFG